MYNFPTDCVTDALQAGASQFEASAGKLKRKYWWKNCKVKQPHYSNNLSMQMYFIVIAF